MVERTEIALLFEHSDNWIGGSYYIINIIKSVALLEDDNKPHIKVYYNSPSAIAAIKKLQYPYITYVPLCKNNNILKRVANRLSKDIFGELIFKQKIDKGLVKNLYPVAEWVDLSNVKGYYYWIPDFQERYLPQFFSKKEIWQREIFQKMLVKNKCPIVFSSNNALNDFNKFYPDNHNRKEILKFFSIIDNDYALLAIKDLKEKYDLKGDYFITPNQFWIHKNHGILLKAAKILKDKGTDFLIVFTGKEFDHRNPDYMKELKLFITDNNLNDNFRFLGFIDRNEQLQLMKNSISIIQPSLFEGWSTVVEDTKALNHSVIVSDLPLHREQINKNCLFFDPLNEFDLANKMEYVLNNNLFTSDFNSCDSRVAFAKQFVSIFN